MRKSLTVKRKCISFSYFLSFLKQRFNWPSHFNTIEDHHLDSACATCDVKLGIVGAFMRIFGFTWTTNDGNLFLAHIKLPHLASVLKDTKLRSISVLWEEIKTNHKFQCFPNQWLRVNKVELIIRKMYKMQILEVVCSRKFLFSNDQFLSNLSAEKGEMTVVFYSIILFCY